VDEGDDRGKVVLHPARDLLNEGFFLCKCRRNHLFSLFPFRDIRPDCDNHIPTEIGAISTGLCWIEHLQENYEITGILPPYCCTIRAVLMSRGFDKTSIKPSLFINEGIELIDRVDISCFLSC